MAVPLRRGANVSLTREIPGLRGVVLGVDWDAGAEVALAENLVMAAILTGADGRALSDDHFVFFNQLRSPDLSVSRLPPPADAAGSDDEQIEVDLPDVPAQVARIVSVLYVNEGPAQRRTLGQLRHLTVHLLDLADDRELVRSEDLAPALTGEAAVVLGELYRHPEGWRFKVVGQGYANGLAGVARDYGITL